MKIKNLIMLLCVAIFVFSSCESETKNNTDNNEFCFKYLGKPKEAITYETAKTLQEEYIQTRANILNEQLIGNGTIPTGEQDTRDVTYNFNTLKQYIAYVEKEAKEKGISVEELGIRVYLGAYPKNSTYEEKGYTTMFFMPIKNSSGKSGKSTAKYGKQAEEVIDGIDGLNLGSSGKPPKDL